MNVLALECGAGGVWPTDQWKECYLEPICPSITEPSTASGLVRAGDPDVRVKVGDDVVYECAQRAEFYETPDVRREREHFFSS